MLKLFYAVGSCALASHIALEEAGARIRNRAAGFRRRRPAQAEYLKINPKGRVPALITDSGILTETPAILAYIAQVYPKADLAPLADPFAFARVQAFNSYLCSTAHVNHAHLMRGTRWADEPSSIEDMKRKAPKNVATASR
jgi:glutathione S-transferase